MKTFRTACDPWGITVERVEVGGSVGISWLWADLWSGVTATDLYTTAWNEGYPNVPKDFTITEKASTRAFSWLKVATTAFTFKTLLRHYAKRALTPQ